ncbi:MAG: hypothetical protein ILA17_05595 [Ruminococcus sp.]|nr:hypothetical protein [Ruminococcus sp.]
MGDSVSAQLYSLSGCADSKTRSEVYKAAPHSHRAALCTSSAGIFSAKSYRFGLTKNLTAHLMRNDYAVLP